MAPAGRFDKTPRPRSQFTPAHVIDFSIVHEGGCFVCRRDAAPFSGARVGIADRQRGVTRCNPQLQFYRVHIQFHLPSYQYGDAPITSRSAGERSTRSRSPTHCHLRCGDHERHFVTRLLHAILSTYYVARGALSVAGRLHRHVQFKQLAIQFHLSIIPA
ncbi:hypothetical protein ACJJTC_019250 [Scirpophaga incertulas]